MIAGKLADLAAKRAMVGFIKSRLGPIRAFNQFARWGYLMPRTRFTKLYKEARDIHRQTAKLLSLGPGKRVPAALTTGTQIKSGTRYVYIVEADVYDPDGVFYKSRYTGISTNESLTIGHAEGLGQAKIADSPKEEAGWEVRNPRVISVLKQATGRK